MVKLLSVIITKKHPHPHKSKLVLLSFVVDIFMLLIEYPLSAVVGLVCEYIAFI